MSYYVDVMKVFIFHRTLEKKKITYTYCSTAIFHVAEAACDQRFVSEKSAAVKDWRRISV